MKCTPIGLIEPDTDRAKPPTQGRYLWRGQRNSIQLEADPTRTVCLNCPAYPASCEQSDKDLPQIERMEAAGKLDCLIAVGRVYRLLTTEIGEAGAATLARGMSAEAYRRYVRQVVERRAL